MTVHGVRNGSVPWDPERLRRARIGGTTRMQCGVCWHVYDPASGDPDAGVPPGTGFLGLPAGWSCPGCGPPPGRFLVADDPGEGGGTVPSAIDGRNATGRRWHA